MLADVTPWAKALRIVMHGHGTMLTQCKVLIPRDLQESLASRC
jgi:hypothetical protein